jgi:hypothetical protein
MADGLFEALSGLNVSAAQNPYGTAAIGIGQSIPQLITPYTSTGRAVGIGLGSVLLQSLLGYQARQQAARETLELNTLANQMQTLATPQERTDFIGGVSDPMYQGRLSTLSTALMQQEAARKAKAAEQLLNLETAADFELGPKGTELFKREQQAALERALAARPTPALKPEKNWWEGIPAQQKQAIAGAAGSIDSLKNLANQFRALEESGVELGLKQYIPGSPEDLAMTQFSTMVPGIAKLLGQLGNLNIYEQQVLDDALKGRMLSGSESIAKRLDQLAQLTQKKIVETTETYKAASEGGGEAVLQKLMGGASTPNSTKINSDIAKLQAVISNPKVSEATKIAARAKIAELSGQ